MNHKSPITFLAALLTLLTLHTAYADVGIVDTSSTNSIAANVTTSVNLGNAIKIGKTDTVGIVHAFQGNAAGTGKITYTWARSADGTTWETDPKFATAATLNGTTAVVNYTNLPNTLIGPAQYIKLLSIANADASATATNATVKVIVKTLKPSP